LEQTTSNIRQDLGIYKREFLGWLLADRLHCSAPIIDGIFISLYFGVLLVLHAIAGHPLPASFGEVFSLPTAFYYYPNLIGVVFDLIGNPFLYVLLVIFRSYIPHQFIQLEQDGLLEEKLSLSRRDRFTQFLLRNRRIQFLAMSVLPLAAGLLFGFVDFRVYQPMDIAAKYAIFLSFIGSYTNMAIIIQLAYVFLILGRYTLNARINLTHPDQCCGLAPFGNLAIAIYTTLFVWAMITAIAISAGGMAWQKVVTSASGPATLIYLWILFPLAILLIFNRLVYQPHQAMRALQQEYLLAASKAWTNYHQNIRSSLTTAVKTSQASLASKSRYNYSDDLELLETWAKLDKYVADMHTWPISNSTVRLIAVFVNPILPIVIPAVTEFLFARLP
jgi:hypothetical protein